MSFDTVEDAYDALEFRDRLAYHGLCRFANRHQGVIELERLPEWVAAEPSLAEWDWFLERAQVILVDDDLFYASKTDGDGNPAELGRYRRPYAAEEDSHG